MEDWTKCDFLISYKEEPWKSANTVRHKSTFNPLLNYGVFSNNKNNWNLLYVKSDFGKFIFYHTTPTSF